MVSPTTMAFPGLGIGEFTVDKVAFSVGSLQIRWYGIIITFGIICAFLYAYYRSKKERLVTDDLLDIGIFTVVFGVLGARLYYVIAAASSGDQVYRSFLDVIAIWEGGLAIYGGIIGGMLAIYFTCLYKKIRWQKLFDMIGPGVMLAQAIGRWGNFFNGEAHGGELVEGSPLYFLRMGLYEGGRMTYFHPTFLYESVWNVLGFVLINVFHKHKKFDGQIALEYIAWYGFGRMFIEALRTDSLYIGHTGIRVSQLLGLLCFLVAGGLLIAGLILARKGKLAVADSVYLPGAKRLRLMEKEAEAKQNGGANSGAVTGTADGDSAVAEATGEASSEQSDEKLSETPKQDDADSGEAENPANPVGHDSEQQEKEDSDGTSN